MIPDTVELMGPEVLVARRFDYSLNLADAAEAEATAAARREAIAEGRAWTVRFETPTGPAWESGTRYAMLTLAKDLAFNRVPVALTDDHGMTITDPTQIRALHY